MEEIKQEQKNPEQKSEEIFGCNKYLVYILAVFVVILIGLFIKSWTGDKQGQSDNYSNNPSASNTSNSVADQNSDLTQTKGDANTGIEVIVNYEKNKSQTASMFRIGFSTHVIDYSGYNFKENVVLRDSQNKEYKASNITTEGAGHHQAIEAAFPLVSVPFKLVVKNLADVPEREFDFK